MSLADQYTLAAATVLTLLRAEPSFYDATATDRTKVFPANLVDYTGPNPYPGKNVNQGPGDFPSAYLVTEPAESDQGPLNQTSAYNGTFDDISQIQFNLFIIGRDATVTIPNALRWAAKIALFKGGIDLGVGSVWKWSFASRMDLMDSLTIGPIQAVGLSPKQVCKLRIAVTFNVYGPTLIA